MRVIRSVLIVSATVYALVVLTLIFSWFHTGLFWTVLLTLTAIGPAFVSIALADRAKRPLLRLSGYFVAAALMAIGVAIYAELGRSSDGGAFALPLIALAQWIAVLALAVIAAVIWLAGSLKRWLAPKLTTP